ncbi:MAG: MFS transporter [Candidatus Schekmanbacteria bacterium]|nr:MFS transporter [Candidatus Schekmanbacteria bacterium]
MWKTRIAREKAAARALPGTVLALGLVSLLMDTSTELVHSVLPIVMKDQLGAPMAVIGLIEGAAEGLAAFTKVFSGALSDYVRRRKLLAVVGYGLAAITKIAFPLAGSLAPVVTARFVDRVGKGIRGAPRDALVADVTPIARRGAAYGLRQSMDSVGAFLGPALAVLCLGMFSQNVTATLWIAVIPAFLAVGVLVLFVREPACAAAKGPARLPLSRAEVRRLPGAFWRVIGLAASFSLARFGEAFLVLRGADVGLSLRFVPLALVVMNVVYAAVAYPAGRASDRLERRVLLLSGLAALIAADGALAAANGTATFLLGAALWGLQMGLTQGLIAKLVAEAAPGDLRGTAFGILNLVSGAALLASSTAAGAIWSIYGPAATFLWGALPALLACGLVLRGSAAPPRRT